MTNIFENKRDLNLKLTDIARILKNIELSVQNYFKNYICYKTGVINPEAIMNLSKEDSIEFLTRLFAICTSELIGGANKNEEGIEEFNDFIKKFTGDIHNLKHFIKVLEDKYEKEGRYSKNNSKGEILSNLFKEFKGIGQKTAALLTKFLCLYCNFFHETPKDLRVPLDRVNARMIYYLIDSNVLINYPNLYEMLKKYNNEKKFNLNELIIEEFQNLAEDVMGSREERIVFDNLWFIGHFYHDSETQDCALREAIVYLDKPYIDPYFITGQQVNLPEMCPLKKIGCKY